MNQKLTGFHWQAVNPFKQQQQQQQKSLPEETKTYFCFAVSIQCQAD